MFINLINDLRNHIMLDQLYNFGIIIFFFFSDKNKIINIYYLISSEFARKLLNLKSSN